MKKNIQESVAGFFVLIGLILIIYMSIKLGHLDLFAGDSYLLYAKFQTVNGLRVGNPIEMHGITIGEVNSFSLDQENQMAVAGLKINKEITIFADAIAGIKTAGLIGDRFVSIDPGGAEKQLANGEYIIDTVSPVDLGELIGKFAFGSIKENK
jgi:phospholipid/cholesterol/gamma-HCH transport system substrate-binding protein